MTYAKTRSALVALALMACALVVPAGASASKASIRAVIRKDSPTILKVEGHIVTAEGEYAATKNPASVEAAIEKSIAALSALKQRVAAQSASSSKIKAGKSKIVKGLGSVIEGYGHLKAAFADKASDPATAKKEAASALAAVKTGKKELKAGLALLS